MIHLKKLKKQLFSVALTLLVPLSGHAIQERTVEDGAVVRFNISNTQPTRIKMKNGNVRRFAGDVSQIITTKYDEEFGDIYITPTPRYRNKTFSQPKPSCL